MQTIALIGQIEEISIQSILTAMMALGFLATAAAVGIIWVVKRSPSLISLVMYGTSFLLLCLPIFAISNKPASEKNLIKVVAVPWNITAVRSRADATSVSIAPYGTIKKGEILLQASSPEMDARLRALESRAEQLELDKKLVLSGQYWSGRPMLSDTDPITSKAESANRDKQLSLQYSADIRSLERQKLPLLRELASIKIDHQRAREDVEQFRDLLSQGFATPAEVSIKENLLKKVESDKLAYKTHLESIEDQISSIQEMVNEIDQSLDIKVTEVEQFEAALEGQEDVAESIRAEQESTQASQIDLQLDAIQLEIDSIHSALVQRAPHDGVVLWKHPSPRSAIPGTPLVAMSKAGESGVLLKVSNRDDIESLPIESETEFSIDVLHSNYQLKGSNFEAKCVIYRSSQTREATAENCELLLTSTPPATLFQDLMRSDFIPLEILVSQTEKPRRNLMDLIGLIGQRD